MKRSLRIGLILLLAAVVAVAAVGIVRKRGDAAPAPKTVPLEFLASDLVTVQPVALHATLPLTGSLSPLQQAAVRAKLSGELRDVLVREGETVRKGQVIARLDTTEYDARLAQARGQMLAAKGEYEKARQVLSRNRDLVAKGFISKTAFENYEASTAVARANLEAANGGLAVAQKMLTDTVIQAPLDGIVATRSAEPGEKVSTDTKLFDIVDLSMLELAAPIPLSETGHVRVGQPVELRADGMPDVAITGTLERINPAAAEGTRSVMVYVSVANADRKLRAGQFVQGGLVLDSRPKALAVPSIAVRSEGERHFVYAIENGKLVEKIVETGLRSADAVEITRGLDAGAQVVRNNLGTLRTGSPAIIKGG